MDESDIWSVDQLAARDLIARLGLTARPDALPLAERHLARHRRTAMEWAAQRARTNVTAAMEDLSQQVFPDHNEQWCAGFCRAQQHAAALSVEEMLKLGRGKAASKGQILRRLMRRAREE